MSSKNPVFSHIVTGATVGRGPVMGPNGAPVVDSHRGVDLAVATGTPVRPVANGVVVYSDYRHDYGNVVVIRHDLNGKEVYSLYAHLCEASPLKKNEQVTPTTTLGLSGSTGRSTGPHVHFEIVERQPGQPGPVAEVRPGQTDLSGYFGYKLLNPKANPDGLLTWDQSRLDRSQLTPAERLAQIRLTEPELKSYGDQLASIETKGKTLEASYAATSKSGKFLGRYQMDPSTALVEAGYTDKTGKWTDYAKAHSVASKEDFLNNPAAQEDALRRLTDKNAEFLVRNNLDLHIGKNFGGESLTGAGLLLGAHNSRGSVRAYVESGGTAEPKDGNGLGISKYVLLGDEVQPGQGHSVSALPVPVGPTNTKPPTTDSITSVAPRNDITYNKEGGKTTGVTLSFYAKADSDDGLIKKGDFVSSAFDLDGQLSYYSVRHTEGGVTTVEERIPVAAKGEAISTSSKWIGNTLISQGQWDSAGNLVGRRYVVDGLTYTRSIGVDGKTQWLDPNGLNAGERIQQSYDQETQRRFSAPPERDPNGLNASERIRQSYDQETQRLFNLHPQITESKDASYRALSVEELKALESGLAQAATARPGTNYADAGSHSGDTTASDAGGGSDQQAQTQQLIQAKTQAGQAASAVGLMNSIIGLQHWDDMSDLQRTAAFASIYNVVDQFTGGGALPGNLGTAASALGLLNALDKGDVGGIAYSGLSLVEHLTSTPGVANSGWISTSIPGGEHILPGLGFALALNSGSPLPAVQPDDEQPWLDSAREQSIPVRIAQASLEVADREIAKSRAAHSPTLDLTAGYGTNYSSGSITSPADISVRSRSRQVGLNLNIPIFSGGGVQARVREALALKYKAADDLEAARRQAATQASQAFTGVVSGAVQVQALASAIASSKSSVDSNKIGFRVGSRINIDVLNAEQQLYTAERDWHKARAETLMQGLRLKAANATLAESDLNAINNMLDIGPQP